MSVRPKKVLIVEDNLDIAMMINRVLRIAGYEAFLAPDAVVALTVARQREPDLILLDLQMPGGGGLTVLERLRTNLATSLTPVIVVTASTTLTREDALDAGAQDFIQKPFLPEDLLTSIDRVLGQDHADRA